MKLSISRNAAVAAAFVSATTRLFLALAVDMPTTHNGAWLSALLGALLALPLALCLNGLDGAAIRPGNAPLLALLLLSTLADLSIVFTAVTRSAGYLALTEASPGWLALPVGLAALWCLHKNGDAVGRGAMVWARLFPALLLLVVVLQARHYRLQWLAPVLGNGVSSVALGGVRAAGCAVPAVAVLYVGNGKGGTDGRCAWTLAASGLIAALLLALRLMLTPTLLSGESWLNRLDDLLTNGRTPLYLQLPMIVLWYAGLMHTLACEGFAAAALLQRLVPKLNGHVCALLAVAAGLLLSQRQFSMGLLYDGLYIPIALATALAAATGARSVGEVSACAP